jgi:hypothetical protein
MMTRLSNPAIIGRQKITDLGYDSHPVRAGNHKAIGVLHGSLSLLCNWESERLNRHPENRRDIIAYLSTGNEAE